jgi:murein DD-endopeptidase MepM/ murein hydrolase activator NlpD
MGAVITGGISVIASCLRAFIAGFLCLMAVSCSSSENYAPVLDVSAYEAIIKSGATRLYAGVPAPAITRHVNLVSESQWLWPARGVLIAPFSSTNKGIDIGGRLGEPIYAAAAGRVVYAGDGLRGYGNLVIIKHSTQYLSAYAYNRRITVLAGEWVKRGQILGEMGNVSSGRAMLHFEVRRDGIPVNPLNLLK